MTRFNRPPTLLVPRTECRPPRYGDLLASRLSHATNGPSVSSAGPSPPAISRTRAESGPRIRGRVFRVWHPRLWTSRGRPCRIPPPCLRTVAWQHNSAEWRSNRRRRTPVRFSHRIALTRFRPDFLMVGERCEAFLEGVRRRCQGAFSGVRYDRLEDKPVNFPTQAVHARRVEMAGRGTRCLFRLEAAGHDCRPMAGFLRGRCWTGDCLRPRQSVR